MSSAALQHSENGKIHFEILLAIDATFCLTASTNFHASLVAPIVDPCKRPFRCLPIDPVKHERGQWSAAYAYASANQQHRDRFTCQQQHGLVAFGQQRIEQQIGHTLEFAQ